jgi:hypothetical protein
MMLEALFLLVQVALCDFVIISPARQPTKVLAFLNDGDVHSFTVIDRSRMTYSKIYSSVPLDVVREDGLHELYFGGHKLCFYDILHPCVFQDGNNGKWKILRTRRGLNMIMNKGLCMHVHLDMIFMKPCDEDIPQQSFIITRVAEPSERFKSVADPRTSFQRKLLAENERRYSRKSRNPPATALL